MKEKKKQWKLNRLYYYANKYYQGVTEKLEIDDINMTKDFYYELRTQIKRGEVIKIQFNAKPRMAKSTGSISVAHDIFEIMKEEGQRDKKDKFTVKKNIAMDQMDFDYKMRDPETTFTVITIDEENESEQTGQDITAIRALQTDQSNIQADRYVHVVASCPSGMIDPNTDIILDIISKDEEEMTIKANITYRWYEQQELRTQQVGYVIIEVKHIIENWVTNVRPKFYRKLQLEAERSRKEKQKKETTTIEKEIKEIEKYIKEQEKEDFYVEYYMKKRKKIELVTKYKITKTRLLRYAEVILIVINRFEKLTKYGNIIKKDMITNNIKMEMKRKGFPQSIVGEELTTREVMGVLEGYKSFWTITRQIDNYKKKYKAGKIPEPEYQAIKSELTTARDEIHKNTIEQKKEYEKCQKLMKEYNQEYET